MGLKKESRAHSRGLHQTAARECRIAKVQGKPFVEGLLLFLEEKVVGGIRSVLAEV